MGKMFPFQSRWEGLTLTFPILGALATAAPSLGQLMKHNGRFGKLPSEGKICFVLAQDEVREQWTIVVVVVVTAR